MAHAIAGELALPFIKVPSLLLPASPALSPTIPTTPAIPPTTPAVPTPIHQVAAPELVSGVSGESEGRIRDLFEQVDNYIFPVTIPNPFCRQCPVLPAFSLLTRLTASLPRERRPANRWRAGWWLRWAPATSTTSASSATDTTSFTDTTSATDSTPTSTGPGVTKCRPAM